MKMMEIKGVDFAYVTLHCGLSNFREIDVEDLTKHKMDSEEMHADQKACDIINKAHEEGHKIVAVGTTVQCPIREVVNAAGMWKASCVNVATCGIGATKKSPCWGRM